MFGKKKPVEKMDSTRILKDAGMQVPEFARYVDGRGMVRFVARKTGDWSVKHNGWREISRDEADSIQRASAELGRGYMKPKRKKYF